MTEPETIAAMATPPGEGGVGIVRLSGVRAVDIASELVGCEASTLVDRQLRRGVVRDREGIRVDEVLIVVMRAPRSFTGEDVAELHGHGGRVNMRVLLRCVLERGARLAEPGEFTRRALQNGKLDLPRAEALLEVIRAGSERAWRVAQGQLEGRLGQRVRQLRECATELLAEVEACIDFPEEDNAYLAAREVGARAAALAEKVGALAATYGVGRLLRDGLQVALTGPANAGKSSLLNALLEEERALVAEEPGTTRDFVDAAVVWDGVPVTLIDTAGLREASSEVEARGIELGRARARRADVRVVLHDGAAPLAVPERPAPGELHVASKGDLLTGRPACLVTSSHTGAGLAELKAAVLEMASDGCAQGDAGEVVTSERQRAQLVASRDALLEAAAGVDAAMPTEMIALDVRTATEALAAVLGEQVGEEVLDALFARFCIGK